MIITIRIPLEARGRLPRVRVKVKKIKKNKEISLSPCNKSIDRSEGRCQKTYILFPDSDSRYVIEIE